MKERVKAIGRLLLGKSLTPEQAFLRGLPVDFTNYGQASTSTAYSNSAIAYACIRRIAVDAGNAPFLILTNPDDPDSVIQESHPISLLFDKPNPWYESNQFMEFVYTMLMLRGEFFIVPDNEKTPTELIQFYDPMHWQESVTSGMRLAGWKYHHDQLSFVAMPKDIIHHKMTNIANPFRGQSPLQAAASALWTEMDGDALSADVMAKGGEQGIVYQTEEKLLPTQEQELQSSLRSRRSKRAAVSNDILLTGGMTILDPKFTGFDYELFDRLGPAEQKIVQVYGLSPSLVGRDDEPNYATFQGRLRVYWRQTLLPLLSAVESTFDDYLTQFGLYFRYDRVNIQGLQEDLKEQSQIALILNRGGIPWDVINERLNLRLDMDLVPGSDEIMVPGTVVPLSLLLENQVIPSGPDPASTPAEPKTIHTGHTGGLPDYDTVLKRSKDIVSMIARNRAIAGLERAVASGWRKQGMVYKSQAVKEMDKAIKENRTPDSAAIQFRDRFGPVMSGKDAAYNIDSVELIQPRHITSLGIGETSVEELVKRMSVDDIKFLQKAPLEYLSPDSLAFIAERENLVVNMGQTLFDSMMSDIDRVIREGGEVTEVGQTVRDMSSSVQGAFTASINRAVTIARTEVGTAFNVGRISNMGEQGYKHHEWITNIDEFTRREAGNDHAGSDGKVKKMGDTFPSGLKYPQEPGGRPEQVINCRCLTIPLTQEQFDERS